MALAPLGAMVTSAQVAGVRLAKPVLEEVRASRCRRHPRKRPNALVADKAYDSSAFRHDLRGRGMRPCIPERRGKRPRPGRKLDLTDHRHRWLVERTFAWLGNFHRLLTRWEHHAHTYAAFLFIA